MSTTVNLHNLQASKIQNKNYSKHLPLKHSSTIEDKENKMELTNRQNVSGPV